MIAHGNDSRQQIAEVFRHENLDAKIDAQATGVFTSWPMDGRR
jgi:hypothetical protein